MCILPQAKVADQCIPGIRQYNRCSLYEIGKLSPAKLHPQVLDRLKDLNILLPFRGTRGGMVNRRVWDENEGVHIHNLQTLPQEISTLLRPRKNSVDTISNTINKENLHQIKFEPNSVCKGQTLIKVCSFNPRSVKNKTLAFSDYIVSNNFDIIAVTETWLGGPTDKACISELVPTGYKITHVPRCGRGGGVAVIHKASIALRLLSSSHDKNVSSFEFMDCNITIKNYTLRLGVVYRPPPTRQNGLKTSTFLEDEWPAFLTKYAATENNIIIVGDVNFHLDNPSNQDSAKFASVLESCGMRQHVTETTPVAGHTLDVLITRDTDTTVSKVEITDPGLPDNTGKTSRDHFAVVFTARAAKPPPVRKSVTYRKLKSINVHDFKKDIVQSDIMSSVTPTSDINELVDAYNKGLASLLDKHAPLKTKTIVLRPSCPWFSEELHDAKHLRRKLERKWRLTRLTIDHEIYRNQCCITNKLLKNAKVSYYTEKVESCGRDQKTLTKVTRHLMGESSEVVLPSGKSSKVLAQEFSDFFVSKIETIRTDIASKTNALSSNQQEYEELEKPFNGEQFSQFSTISEQELAKIIQKSPSKSCELDPIPTWLLKDCLNELLPSVTQIVNASLENANVPTAFKSSRIRPLIKKHGLDQNVMKNYRPVSNLPFISKVLEKVVDSQLEKHLTEHNLHEERQSAYRKFHSTETALLCVQNDILCSLDQNEATVLVMLDLSAAFDTIDHSTLLRRLEQHFGIAGKPLKWMKSYLSDRFQTVCIDGELSTPVHMTYSVPQGSVLGPKNYVMYTKPVGAICRKHNLQHHFYADDSQLYLAFKPKDSQSRSGVLQRIEECLNDIIVWMNNNLLKLNADKTEVIVFTPKRIKVENLTVQVGNAVIKPTSHVRNLGALLDSHLDMEQHVNSISRSCYMQIRQIGQIRKYLTVDATKSLINSHVTSRLDYCNSLLSGSSKSILDKLQRVQNTAARVITKTSRYSHITPVLRELHWLPVHTRVEFKVLVYVFKALHGQVPIYIRNLLEVYTPRRQLRSQDECFPLVVPKTRTVTYGDRCFMTAAPKLWNALPNNLRSCETLPSFKRALKTHFFMKVYSM